MHLTLLTLTSVAVFFYTDAAPRWSWGSFADVQHLLQSNKSTELCSSSLCVQWAECEVYETVMKFKPCSDKRGGPWICCLKTKKVTTENFQTDQEPVISLEASIRTNDSSRDDSLSLSHDVLSESIAGNMSGSSTELKKATEGIIVLSNETFTSIHEGADILPSSIEISKTSHYGLLISNGDHSQPKHSSNVEAEQNETLNIIGGRSSVYSSNNFSNVLLSKTAVVPLDAIEDNSDIQSSPIIKYLQNGSAVADSGNIYDDKNASHSSSIDESNLPITERQIYYPDRLRVEGGMNRNYPYSNYYFGRPTSRTTPSPQANFWNGNHDMNHPRRSEENHDSRYWRKPTKATPKAKTTKRTWGNAYTLSDRKITKGSSKPAPDPWGITAATIESRSETRKTTASSFRKPPQNRDHLEKRSTKIRKVTTTPQSWSKTKRPEGRGTEHKTTEARELRTTPYPRNKPVPWNRDSTTPSWSISTGIRSGRTTTKKSTNPSKVTKHVLKPTTAVPKRYTVISATKSTVNRRTYSTVPTRINPLPDNSARTCGVRRDVESASRRRGRSAVYHPDSVPIHSNVPTHIRGRSFQRIVGGTEAEPFSWPWVAAIYKVTSTGGNRFLSAGSLINENFVLTAAHVFTAEDLRSASFVVMLGTHTAKEAVAEYPVMSVLRHPDYQQRYYYNDIALLRLARPVVFNDYVMPVCLPSYLMSDRDLIGTRVTVMGWGDQSYGGITSRVLKEATLPIVSRQTCNASYVRVASNRFPRGITSNMLCAGAPDGGKDACQGDSGGPLTSVQNDRHILLGIVSFGYRCGDKEYPGVYTRVASFLDWITENANCEDHLGYYDYSYTS